MKEQIKRGKIHYQPVRGDDIIILVAMTSTYEQRSLVWEAFASVAELLSENQ